MEIWKMCEGEYEVSSEGRVRRNNAIIKPRLDRYGYELVTFWINGKIHTRKVHRLVAISFIENPENLATVNHKDGIKTNNQVSNLEWQSAGDNMRHGFATGLHTIGQNRKAGRKVKLTDANVREIKALIKAGYRNTEIGKLFGVSCGCIYSIRVNKSWTHITI